MKILQRFFYPSCWSLTTQLSIAMLTVAWTPMLLLWVYRPLCQNRSTGFVLGAIATVLLVLLAKWIVNPIRLLTKAAKALERGNFAPPGLVKVAEAQNDTGYLARVFSKLVNRVKAAQELEVNQGVTTVLLRELNPSDINWLGTVGRYWEIAPGKVLTQAGQTIDTFHLVLDGSLAMTVSKFAGNYLDRMYAQTDAISAWEVAQLGSGEVIGEHGLIDTHATAATTIEALQPSLVLSIPLSQLGDQLKQDVGFAARLYRAIAILLSNRLQTLMAQVGCNSLTQNQPLRGVLSVLGALHDSDIDWLVAIGQRQKILANSVLLHQGSTIEALYILLDGTLTVSVFDDVWNPFIRAFSVANTNQSPSQEITRLSKGEMVGEVPFLTAHLPLTTVTALEDSFMLTIPRSHLVIKLEQDVGFASRFYRMLANLLANRLQELLERLGYVEQVDDQVPSLNGTISSDNELNFNALDQMAIAGTRFDWMLKRLGGTEVA